MIETSTGKKLQAKSKKEKWWTFVVRAKVTKGRIPGASSLVGGKVPRKPLRNCRRASLGPLKKLLNP